MNRKETYMTVSIITIMLLVIIIHNYLDKPGIEKRKEIEKSYFTNEISGKVVFFEEVRVGTTFKLSSSDSLYKMSFYPINSKRNLIYEVELGDSLYKAPNSDTVFLMKPNGKRLIFTFFHD